MRKLRLFLCALLLAGGLALPAASPAFGQTPSPSPAATATAAAEDEPSAYALANWSKYLAFLLAGLGVAVLGMAAVGWLVQSPGFRRSEESE